MADLPIPFSPPMVCALLAGRKTQTRRVIKPRAWNKEGDRVDISIAKASHYIRGADGRMYFQFDHPLGGPLTACVSHINVGDRLWVSEAWRTWRDDDELTPLDIVDLMDRDEDPDWRPNIEFIADGAIVPRNFESAWDPGRRRAGMHLPRRLSRTTLVVTDVRVQRLQDIDLHDARAEGCQIRNFDLLDAGSAERDAVGRGAYQMIWEDINGPGSWAANPWVAAYSFSVHRCNIDAMEATHG